MSNPNLFPASGNVIWSQKNARIHFQILVSSPPPIYDILGIITFYHLTTLHINVPQVCCLGGRSNDPKAHLQLSYCSNGICLYMCFPWIVLLHISQFSHLVVCDSLQPHGLQHTRLPCPSLTSSAWSNSCPLSWWRHPTISSSLNLSSPALNLSQHQGLFQWVDSLHQVAKVLELQL